MTPWKRFSAAELEELRVRLFSEVPGMISAEEARRLLNERDALEHAMMWSNDGQRAMNEFLTMMEHCFELREENAELRRRLAQYEQPCLGAVV
ncbi:hypothetical protein QO009_002015 [Brevibacillus aydinogluensis]|uniref:hypothetical protein n=1 Tax=Brevibacillus aydinogluensis TaxID=927786 RepID=UPI0028936FA5|nr:hypothetical protein [Brevibacillus aydinogluensis]MDT3416147.1 hypothetical protein [Brevibacillus aydinogluensis]